MEEVKNTNECSICYYHYNKDLLPHFSCAETHKTASVFNVCQSCFFRWIHGEINSDNVGFKHVRCNCSVFINYDDIKQVLSPAQFESYDDAITKAALERDTKNIGKP